MQRSDKIIEILTALTKKALVTLEIMDEVLPNYHRSYKNAKRGLYVGALAAKYDWKRGVEKQKFYSLLNYLKRQGFVEKKPTSNKLLWKITSTGLDKLGFIKNRRQTNYEIISDGKLKIIAYDIPEKERFKRLWLREALKTMNFKMLQKSLAAGKNKIPEAFLEDLRKKHMLPHVHMFEVSKAGTIRELI